jgi:hypothetical protein
MQETTVERLRKYRTNSPKEIRLSLMRAKLEAVKAEASPFIVDNQKSEPSGFSVSRASFMRFLATFFVGLTMSVLAFSYLTADLTLNPRSMVPDFSQGHPTLTHLAAKDQPKNQMNSSADLCYAFTDISQLPPFYPEHFTWHPSVYYNPVSTQDTCPAKSPLSTSTNKIYLFDTMMPIASELFDILWEWVFRVAPPPS